MTVDEVERHVAAATANHSFIMRTTTLDKTANTIKMRLEISPTWFVQIYWNVKKKIINFALVGGTGRAYGRDCDGGGWHRHPFDKPEGHDFSDEGSLESDIDGFLEEVQDFLLRHGIL